MESPDSLQVDGQPLTDQEQFILEQTAQGKPADLKKKFGDKEKNRQVRSRFLEELLSDGLDQIKIHRQGIRIANAIIYEPFKLELATVLHTVFFNTCEFKEKVDLGHAYFMKYFAISGSTFYASAKFRQMKVDGNLLCRKTTFRGPVDFGRVQVDEDFDAKGARFENKEHHANFNSIRVGQNASFNGALFQGPVDFTLAKVEGNFSIEVLIEDGVEKETVFENSVSFAGFSTNGQFQAERTRFEGVELVKGYQGNAVFMGMRVKDNVLFDGALFKGDVDFSAIKVEGNLSIMPIKKDCLEIKSSFKGNVNFAGARIGQQFQAEAAYFGDTGKPIIFSNMKVDQSASFDGAVFHGLVNFGGVAIKEQFSLEGAQFLNGQPSIFEGMTVGLSIIFRDALFHGGITINHASFMDLFIQGESLCPLIPLINLEHTVVQRELRIENAKIEKLEASHLQVTGPASLTNVSITNSADFQNASCQIINLSEVTWPASADKVLLEGLTYNAINAGIGKEDWKKLLAWVQGSRFNTQVYSQLENYFQRCGYKERANQVFIRMKDREREMAHEMGRWLWNLFLKITIGYGRKPRMALYFSLFFFIIGIFAFWDSEGMVRKQINMESRVDITSQISEAPRPRYDPVWYSVDLLLPIDLGMAKHWEPNPERSLAWHYAKVQMIIGWVLIGVLIVAATGIIK